MACSVTNPEQEVKPHISTLFESEPELFGEQLFNLDENLDILTVAEKLAMEAKHLIGILKNAKPADIREQYQIELRKINPHDESCFTYRMSLRVDNVIWFKCHKLHSKNVENMKKLYEMGICYIDKVKNEIENYPAVENENDIKRVPIDTSTFDSWCKKDRQGKDCPLKNNPSQSCGFKHYKWCDDENYGSSGNCKSNIPEGNHKKMYIHFYNLNQSNNPVNYLCRFQSVNINRQKVTCQFCVNSDFWIYQGEVSKPSVYPYFIVSARSDATPIVTLNPVKHCLNEEYLQTSDAWQAVLLTLIYMKKTLKLDKLPLHRIYINFGKWMQQKVDDPMYRSLHAHINIVLSHETIGKISQSYKQNDDPLDQFFTSKDKKKNQSVLFPPLVGSLFPPKCHRLDDTWKLIEYMNNHMTPLLFMENQKFMKSVNVNILIDRLNEVEKELEHLRKSLYGSTNETVESEDMLTSICPDDIGIGINEKALSYEDFSNETIQ